MRKSNTKFHMARQSGRNIVRNIRGRLVLVDTCKAAHEAVNDKAAQFMANPLLGGVLNRFEQGRIYFAI